MNALPASDFFADAEGFASGLEGTIGVTVQLFDGTEFVARQIVDIAEQGTGTGFYRATVPGLAAGDYVLAWDDGSGNFAYEPLYVAAVYAPYYTTWVDSPNGIVPSVTPITAAALNHIEDFLSGLT